MNEKGLGKRLQEARQAAGLTQQQLCQKANLSFSTLTKIERGAIKSPSIFTIQSIAEALQTTIDTLLGLSSSALAEQRKLHRTKNGASFIYFDLNGCLVRYYHRAFAEIALVTGRPIENIEMIYLQYNDAVCRGTMSMSDFNETMASRLGVPSIDWGEYYLDAAEPVEAMHELLVWAADYYRVGLLTNGMPGLLEGLKKRGKIPDLPYEVVIDSSQVGCIKPEKAIYDLAVEKAGVPEAEIMLIDDTMGNLAAVQDRGWQVMLFDTGLPEESSKDIREVLTPAE
jgi:transcriptional regulator with XRE-family HTH domain